VIACGVCGEPVEVHADIDRRLGVHVVHTPRQLDRVRRRVDDAARTALALAFLNLWSEHR
jgi:hypothetical protein